MFRELSLMPGWLAPNTDILHGYRPVVVPTEISAFYRSACLTPHFKLSLYAGTRLGARSPLASVALGSARLGVVKQL